MFEMKLYDNNLTIEYKQKSAIMDGTFCGRSLENILNRYNLSPIEHNFKKNFKLISLKKNYIIYNEKNQAIIDTNIFNILNHFNIEEMNQELLEMLYKLEFIISE